MISIIGRTVKIIGTVGLLLVSQWAWAYGQFRPLMDPSHRGPVDPNQHLLLGSDQENSRILNAFSGTPGCYILCISRDQGLYPIGPRFWFQGLIRISGKYATTRPSTVRSEQLCYPSAVPQGTHVLKYFESICNQNFSTCQNTCWGNGETGGFFTRRPQVSQ